MPRAASLSPALPITARLTRAVRRRLPPVPGTRGDAQERSSRPCSGAPAGAIVATGPSLSTPITAREIGSRDYTEHCHGVMIQEVEGVEMDVRRSYSLATPALAQDIADKAGGHDGGQDRERALHEGFLHIVFRPALLGLVQKRTCELGRRPCRQRGGQNQDNPLLHIPAQALASSVA